MIFGTIDTVGGGQVVNVAVEFLREGESYVRIGEYKFPLDKFVNSLIFEYVGEPNIVGYLNRKNRAMSGKVYELRKPKLAGVMRKPPARRMP